MNDQQIFEAVARAGRLRAVQLADRLDVVLEDAQGKLAALVAVGDLVEIDGLAPNGLPTKFYEFSEAFKGRDAYQLLTRKAEAANFTGAPGMSKVDRAIAFVREKGTATSSELHALLELKPEQTASTWLAGALKDGRLVRDGKNWTIGIDKPAAEPSAPLRKSTFSKTVANKGPVAQFPSSTPVEVPQFLEKRVTMPSKPKVEAPAPVEQKAVDTVEMVITGEVVVSGDIVEIETAAPASESAEQPAAPAFRAGLWSDGTLELQRNGETIATLRQDEGEQLAEFMQRMRVLLAA